jgi:hypothetical protein
MSPRAACRLETLGFVDVYDYVPGKLDWLAHNLPVEGEQAGVATAGRLARDDAATCRLEEPVGEVRADPRLRVWVRARDDRRRGPVGAPAPKRAGL